MLFLATQLLESFTYYHRVITKEAYTKTSNNYIHFSFSWKQLVNPPESERETENVLISIHFCHYRA